MKCPNCQKSLPQKAIACCFCMTPIPDAYETKAPKKERKSRIPEYYVRPDGLHETIMLIPQADGSKKRKAFRGKTDEEVYKKVLAFQNEKETGRLFAEACDELQEKHYKRIRQTTQDSYDAPFKRIRAEFGELHMREVTPEQIEHFYEELKYLGLTAKTIKNHHNLIRLIFKHDGKLIDYYNPAEYVDIPTGCKAPVKRELPSDADLAKVDTLINDKAYGLLYFFVKKTGVRRGEAFALRKRHIDFEGKWITVEQSSFWDRAANKQEFGPTKNKKVRQIPLKTELANVLRPILHKMKPDDLLFHLPGRSQIDQQLTRYREKTGLTSTLHQFRHYYATDLYHCGIPVTAAAEFFGDSLEVMQQVYVHLGEEEKNKAAAKFITGGTKTDNETKISANR